VTAPAWWAALGPAETTAACGEQQHRLRWEAGRLTAPDHPEAEGELVLGALGGEQPDCIRLLGAWGEHSDDLDVLMLGPRSAADTLTVGPEAAGQLRLGPQGWVAYSPLTRAGLIPGMPPTWGGLWHRTLLSLAMNSRPLPRGSAAYGPGAAAYGPGAAAHGPGAAVRAARVARRRIALGAVSALSPVPLAARARRPGMGQNPDREHARRAELIALLALGPAFQFRLCATVAAAWADRDPGTARPALTAALAGRLAPAISAWLHVSPDEVRVSLADGPCALARERDGWQAGMRWVASVWGPGLALVEGNLVVDVTRGQYPEAEVLALAEPAGEPAVLTVRCENAAGSAQAPRWRIIRP